MSVLIIIDQTENQIKKSSYEALTYGVSVAHQLGTNADALVLGKRGGGIIVLGIGGEVCWWWW